MGHIPPLIVRVAAGISEKIHETTKKYVSTRKQHTNHASEGKVLSEILTSTGACECMKKKFKILQFLNETMSEESQVAE